MSRPFRALFTLHSFTFTLLFRLSVAALGWAAASYIRGSAPHWPNHLLADFPGLPIDLSEERLDGFIALTPLVGSEWRRLAARGVVGCRLDTWNGGQQGVYIDVPRFEEEALAALRAAGCKRLARTNALKEVKRPGVLTVPFTPGPDGSRELARSLLAMPLHKVPDGLALADDYAAAAVISHFLAAGRQPPQIAVLTNRQLPIHFEHPVLAFEVDIEELAGRAVAVLQRRILGDIASGHIELVAAQRVM